MDPVFTVSTSKGIRNVSFYLLFYGILVYPLLCWTMLSSQKKKKCYYFFSQFHMKMSLKEDKNQSLSVQIVKQNS